MVKLQYYKLPGVIALSLPTNWSFNCCPLFGQTSVRFSTVLIFIPFLGMQLSNVVACENRANSQFTLQ